MLDPVKGLRVFWNSVFSWQVFRETNAKGFDSSQYQTVQVFYPSKDGTKIPMFIVHKKVSAKTKPNSLLAGQPLYFQYLISNSPYCLRYNSYDIGSENLILNQLIIP